jgi:uncharacterized protein GlcG (DUF336 family)
MSEITLNQSERVIDAILARGRELNCRPLSVAVTDPGAHVKAFKKDDGSAMMRFEMAMGKAYMGYLINASGGKIFPEGGGRLIRNDAGEIIGAVGVTGDTEARDEELAAHGIRAAGLKTDEDCAGLGHRVRLKN